MLRAKRNEYMFSLGRVFFTFFTSKYMCTFRAWKMMIINFLNRK